MDTYSQTSTCSSGDGALLQTRSRPKALQPTQWLDRTPHVESYTACGGIAATRTSACGLWSGHVPGNRGRCIWRVRASLPGQECEVDTAEGYGEQRTRRVKGYSDQTALAGSGRIRRDSTGDGIPSLPLDRRIRDCDEPTVMAGSRIMRQLPPQ